jgi:hypothetical protein
MSDISESYAKGVWDRYKYYANWLPNSKVELGDVGIIVDKKFDRVTTLKNLGVHPNNLQIRPGTSRMRFEASAGAEITAGGAVEVPGGSGIPAEASVKVGFSKKGSFLFQAENCIKNELEDLRTLESQIYLLNEKRIWEKEWAVITGLVQAGSTTILVSESDSSEVELKGKSKLGPANLADIEAGIQFSIKRGNVVNFVAAEGLTPLFTLHKVKQSFWDRLQKLWNSGIDLRECSLDINEGDILESVSPY